MSARKVLPCPARYLVRDDLVLECEVVDDGKHKEHVAAIPPALRNDVVALYNGKLSRTEVRWVT